MALAVAPLVKRNIPDFVAEESPNFVAFFEAYYEWMEQRGGINDKTFNLTDYRSVDTTVDEYIEYFRNEFLVTIPTTVLADKRLLAKHIRDFYRAKGTEKSYKFLFRILFNEDVSVSYPKLNVIRASDGKWQEDIAIKTSFSGTTINLDALTSCKLVGVTSGATAVVENAFQSSQGNINYVEFFLSGLEGEFATGEDISVLENGTEKVIFTEKLLTLVGGFEIVDGGSGYKKNDTLFVVDNQGNRLGNGRVLAISTSQISSIALLSGGEGYNGRRQIIYDWENLRIGEAVDGESLQAVPISNYSALPISRHKEDSWLTRDLGTPDTIIIDDALGSNGSGAKGEVTLINDYGTIETVSLTSRGNKLYNRPSYKFLSENGEGGEIIIVGGGGAITKARLDTFPINTGNLSVDTSQGGDANAVIHLTETTLAKYPGRWVGTESLLSSDQKIHDGYYYQDFSYVLSSSLEIPRWKEAIKNIVHPAGLELFGIYQSQMDHTDTDVLEITKPSTQYTINLPQNFSVVAGGAVETLTLHVHSLLDNSSSIAKQTKSVVYHTDANNSAGDATKTQVVSQMNGQSPFTGTFDALEFEYLAGKNIQPYQDDTLNEIASGVNVYNNDVRVKLAGTNDVVTGTAAGEPALHFDFINNPVIDPRMSFSRTSHATYFGSDGVLKYAPHNLLTYSAGLPFSYTDNITTSSVSAPDGTNNAVRLTSTLTGGANQVFADKSLPVLADNTTRTFSVYLKKGTSAVNTLNFYYSGGSFLQVTGTVTWAADGSIASYVVANTSGAVASGNYTDVGGGWYRCWVTLRNNGTNNASVSRVYVHSQGSANVSGQYVDVFGYQLEIGSTVGAYNPTTSAAYYGPRFEYKPVIVNNLLTYSEQFEHANWTPGSNAAVVTSNTDYAPDGNKTADTLTDSDTNPLIRQQIASVANDTLTRVFSVFFKRGTAAKTNIHLTYFNGTLISANAELTWATGAVVVTGTNATGGAIQCGDYVRLWLAFPNNGTGNTSLTCRINVAGQNAADTGTVVAWGAQLEQASVPGPYVSTTSSAVTNQVQFTENLFTYSNDFANGVWSKTNLTVATDSIVSPDYTSRATRLVASASGGAYMFRGYQPTKIEPITFSFFARAVKDPVTVSVRTQRQSPFAVISTTSVTLTTEWQRIVVTFTPLDTSGHGLHIGGSGGGTSFTANQEFYIYGAQLERHASAGVYIPTTSAANYKECWVPAGLLIEETRTNLLKSSGNYADNSVWIDIFANATRTTGIDAPDGSTSAVRLNLSGANATVAPLIRQTFATPLTNGTTYTFSCWMRWISGPQFFYVDVNDAVGLPVAPQWVLGKWVRCAVTFTATAAHTFIDFPSNTSTAGPIVDIWGAQLEQGSFPTSYIPTTTASATRAADVLVSKEALAGNNLIANGKFDYLLENWTNISVGGATAGVVAGQLVLTTVNTSERAGVTQQISTVSGKTYKITLDYVSGSNNHLYVYAGTTPGGNTLLNGTSNQVGAVSLNFTATGASTYISLSTSAGAITHVVDNISVKEVVPFDGWNHTEGTVLVSTDSLRTDSAAVEQVVVSFDDGTSNNRILNTRVNGTFRVYNTTTGATDTDQSQGTWLAGPFKGAFAYKQNDYGLSTKGNNTIVDSTASTPKITNFRLGGWVGGTASINGHIRSFTYFPTRLSNAVLQTLSGD